MQIAVAGMKDVRESQMIFRTDAIGFRQHFRQTRTRHDRILNHDVRAQPADGPECTLTRRPKFLSLFVFSCPANRTGAIVAQNTLSFLGRLVDASFNTVKFHQQYCLSIYGKSGGEYACFDRANDRVVHHLEGSGQQTGSDDRRDCTTRIINTKEIGEQRAHGGWNRRELHRRFGGNAERAF